MEMDVRKYPHSATMERRHDEGAFQSRAGRSRDERSLDDVNSEWEQRLITQAVEAEVAELMALYVDQQEIRRAGLSLFRAVTTRHKNSNRNQDSNGQSP